MLVISPIYLARTLRGTEEATMARQPEKTPAEPSPEIARPKMSITDPVASAAMSDPTMAEGLDSHGFLLRQVSQAVFSGVCTDTQRWLSQIKRPI